jgi:hypothetical protein
MPNLDPSINREHQRVTRGFAAAVILMITLDVVAIINRDDSSPATVSRGDSSGLSVPAEAVAGDPPDALSNAEKERYGAKQKELLARLSQAATKDAKIAVLIDEGCGIEGSPLEEQFYYADLLDAYRELMDLDVGPDQDHFRQAQVASGCPPEKMPHQITPRGGHDHH